MDYTELLTGTCNDYGMWNMVAIITIGFGLQDLARTDEWTLFNKLGIQIMILIDCWDPENM